jgi:hypothetical protein
VEKQHMIFVLHLPFTNHQNGEKMKKTIYIPLILIVLALSACAPQPTAAPTPSSVHELPTMPEIPDFAATETLTPVATGLVTSTPTAATEQKQYTNSAFKFGFKYPSSWFGPDEYISDNTLRIAVGSDVVFPYGEGPETPSAVKNSYLVVVQYTKNSLPDNPAYKTYQALTKLQDGESLSSPRNLTTRVRELHFGRFDGFEYISTLSETARTEFFYAREVLLIDHNTNDVITVIAQPTNVKVSDTAQWREVYKGIDEANLSAFHELIESITVE